MWSQHFNVMVRQNSRRLEWKYRRTGRPTTSDWPAWVEHECRYHKICRQKEHAFWDAQLIHYARQPKKLWNTLSSILGSSKPKQLPKNIPLAQDIHPDFFNSSWCSWSRSRCNGSTSSHVDAEWLPAYTWIWHSRGHHRSAIKVVWTWPDSMTS